MTYVYAAYLAPGLHSFLIYDPKYKQLFCKDLMIDLSQTYYYPEYPKPYRPAAQKKKKTKQNVWRMWREDSKQDIELAFIEDTESNLQPSLFIRDVDDAERCKQFLYEKFDTIKIVHIMNIEKSFDTTYPEQDSKTFINMMMKGNHI